MEEATLYVDTFDLAAWLVQHVQGPPVGDAVHRDALQLLDHVVIALRGIDRRHHIDEADVLVTLLRVRVRLAHEVGLLDERRLLFCTERLDRIGRRLGGWIRQLDRGTLGGHHR